MVELLDLYPTSEKWIHEEKKHIRVSGYPDEKQDDYPSFIVEYKGSRYSLPYSLLEEDIHQIIYDIFRQKAHGFNRGMNATCM